MPRRAKEAQPTSALTPAPTLRTRPKRTIRKKNPEPEGIIDLNKPPLNLDLVNVKRCEGTAYNSRYFYFFARYSDEWVLFEFDSVFKQTFTMYNAMDLNKHFTYFDFKYVPYTYDLGMVYNEQLIAKVELDHEAKTLRVIDKVFELPPDHALGLTFYIHTVLILQNDTVFIYTIRKNNNVSQRLYLYTWSNMEEKVNMCKIGIRDARAALLYVSGQFVEGKRLCIIQMQDKNRAHGQITPLSLYWDTDGPVGPEKFEKVECEDGMPFVKTIGSVPPSIRKQFSGAWFGHTFNMIFTAPTPAGKRWKTSAFIFDAFLKTWRPMTLPQQIKSSLHPLVSFQNGGGNSHVPMLCFFKKDDDQAVPSQMFRMPVRSPEKLKTLAQIETAKYGIFDVREKLQILSLRVQIEQKLSEEYRRKAEEHRKRARQHSMASKELEKQKKRMRKEDVGSSIVPDQLCKFFEIYDD